MKREPVEHELGLTSSQEKDEELVQRTLAGDKSAFDILVTRYRDRVFSLACHMLWDKHEAEDIAQEVFVRAYQGLKKFRQESTFFTWLYRIAMNLVYTQARKTSRRRQIYYQGFNEISDIFPSHDPTPEDAAASEELRNMVLKALQQLDPRFQQVIVLKELEGMDVAEVAEVLQIPLGTVKSRLFRAREDLRRILEMQAQFKTGRS